MYQVIRNGKPALEADACGIGFVASRHGAPSRQILDEALELCKQFDHRGAPGHGAGIQLDIPWALLLDRFGSKYSKLIANRRVALGMFFLPYENDQRRKCVEVVDELAKLAGAPVLQWVEVDVNEDALPKDSSARRTLPRVRQALFARPETMREDEWFACRYLLRLALDQEVGDQVGDDFSVVSLSNRTVVYKSLCELSRIGDFYPDLQDPDFISRYVLFHSRYCTNTTTAWRRAQPFWALAHNGEINTIAGNGAWMRAIGKDLIQNLADKFPRLSPIADKVGSIINRGGSDTADLDDMVIALVAGGMSVTQALLALVPEATSFLGSDSQLHDFYRSMGVFLGVCDGPAALVACDGDEAVAHLDRNGLRPLWICTTDEYAIASSEMTGTFPRSKVEMQRVLGPGETVTVNLNTGAVLLNEQVHEDLARRPFRSAANRIVPGGETMVRLEAEDLVATQRAFGMTKEDVDVVLEPMIQLGKPAVGSMGDDTSPAAMLDALPRRVEDYFTLRFAQETSPPIDPIRDAWVFDTSVALGDRSGLWTDHDERPVFMFPDRVLSSGQLAWIEARDSVSILSLLFPVEQGEDGLESHLRWLEQQALEQVGKATILLLSDRGVNQGHAAVPALRAVSRIHKMLVDRGLRHRVGIVADSGVWDIHQVAIAVSMGADAVCPWLGIASSFDRESTYLKGLRSGFAEAMSMMGVTPASAYCGARLVEAIGLDRDFANREFPGVPVHLGGIGADVLNREWLSFHAEAFAPAPVLQLVDAGEFRHSKSGRAHSNNAEIVRSLQMASGYSKKIHAAPGGSREAYSDYSKLVSDRPPITLLDCLRLKSGDPIPLEDVEPVENILWRFMAPGMSEGALSEPSHRSVARAMNILRRYVKVACTAKGKSVPIGIGPIANSGEGGFEKDRVGTRDANLSVQYAGGRFTITPMTAARALEAEVKFAQGAKPGKGGQLPGKKVSVRVARQRGCEPGFELVSPPINHNLYSIEDVKLMVESWRHLNPDVNCALKYVATYGVEMVVLGGVNAGANRLHISDGCGGTGAAKRVDQKHAGVPVMTVLPTVQDTLVEEGMRHLVEISVDGGVQNGEQALKLMLLGADRVGFGTSLLIAIGCSMLRKCHLAGPDPADPTGKRRLGCAPGVATQDPVLVAKFSGKARHIARYLRFVALEIRDLMAAHGISSLGEVIGKRDLLEKKELHGKADLIDFDAILLAPHEDAIKRNYALQTETHKPEVRTEEVHAAQRALKGETIVIRRDLTNVDRCVGVGAAGVIARAYGDAGLPVGTLRFEHGGAAGHFYAAYMVEGMEYRLEGLVADSCFTASYGGKLVIRPSGDNGDLTIVGNTFGYGARGGRAFLAGRAGNRFGICLRKNSEGGGPTVVVEGVEANAFQYMTGGTALVLGSTGFNLGSGLTGGRVYLYQYDPAMLNKQYVKAEPLDIEDAMRVKALIEEHLRETGSPKAAKILQAFEPNDFVKVTTCVVPELVE
ncbi:MAG: glutamate synthase-related protein [Fimbriimonas sp.]